MYTPQTLRKCSAKFAYIPRIQIINGYFGKTSQIPNYIYRLLTVTYGTAAAPFLANRVLKQLALDEGMKYPLAVSILKDNVYVDDLMFGAEDIVLLRRLLIN